MCSWRYREGHTSRCRYVWPQCLFGKSRRNPHQHFITTQSVKNRRYKTDSCWSWSTTIDRQYIWAICSFCMIVDRARFYMQQLTSIHCCVSGRQCVNQYDTEHNKHLIWHWQTSNIELYAIAVTKLAIVATFSSTSLSVKHGTILSLQLLFTISFF